MSVRRKLLVALLGAVLPLACWSVEVPVEAGWVLKGRALYRGEQPFEKPPTLQGVNLAGAACSQCHGLRGDARMEAGVSVPSIRWQSLMQSRDSLPGYGEAVRVARAIAKGEGRQGEALQAPMPRFQMTVEEQRSLLAYLRVLATDQDPVPGVSAQRVVVGSVLPLSGSQASVGERIRSALAQRFEAINIKGGVFGRRIELRVIDGGSDAVRASRVARTALEDAGSDIFALVGSLLPDPDEELRRLLKVRHLPMVATLGVALAEPDIPEVTYLLPSLEAQVRGLATELDKRCGSGVGKPVVVHPPGARALGVIQAALPLWHMEPLPDATAWRANGAGGDSPRVIALLARDQMADLRARFASASSSGCLGTLAVISGRPPTGASRHAEVVALPMPPVVQDGALAEGATLWTTLGDTAATVFVEALARSGRVFDTEKFSQSLDTLHRFQPVPGFALSYGPQHRHGFDVTYLWRENTHGTPH